MEIRKFREKTNGKILEAISILSSNVEDRIIFCNSKGSNTKEGFECIELDRDLNPTFCHLGSIGDVIIKFDNGYIYDTGEENLKEWCEEIP